MSELGTDWRYEVRGSFVYDCVTEETLDLIQTAQRLQETFVRAGVWAAKAGLLEADLRAEKERAERLELALRRIHELALTRQSVAEIGRRAGAALSTPEETDAH